tara:strand:- start:1209 stop:1787 length:579 start_codon:yes stop_codon:yes gene_type:complete
MKKIYQQIWKLALPYYKKGRYGDTHHIEWMMKEANQIIKKEKLDDSIFLPLVILHDIGYAMVKKDNPFKLDLRKAHMKEGAILAEQILNQINYPKNKTKIITYYISVHDNWAFKDYKIFKKDKLLGIFNDLDFTWMFTPKGFNIVRSFLKYSPKEMVDYLIKQRLPTRGFFSSKISEQIYKKYFKKIEKHKT